MLFRSRATEVELRRWREGRRVPDDALAGSANQWADERKNVEQFAYDADEAAERWWREGGERKVRAAAKGGAHAQASERQRARL